MTYMPVGTLIAVDDVGDNVQVVATLGKGFNMFGDIHRVPLMVSAPFSLVNPPDDVTNTPNYMLTFHRLGTLRIYPDMLRISEEDLAILPLFSGDEGWVRI